MVSLWLWKIPRKFKYFYLQQKRTCTRASNLWLTLNDILFTSFPFDTLFGLVICYRLFVIINGIIPRYHPYIKVYNLSYSLYSIYILLIAFQSLISLSLRPFHGLNVGQGRTRQKYNSIILSDLIMRKLNWEK